MNKQGTQKSGMVHGVGGPPIEPSTTRDQAIYPATLSEILRKAYDFSQYEKLSASGSVVDLAEGEAVKGDERAGS